MNTKGKVIKELKAFVEEETGEAVFIIFNPIVKGRGKNKLKAWHMLTKKGAVMSVIETREDIEIINLGGVAI